jgi:putative transposase
MLYMQIRNIHFIMSRSPKLSEEYFSSIVAESSERFINENKLCAGHFAWQKTAAAFSVSKADVNKVCKYILNQPRHHHKITFNEEYESFMKFYQKTLNAFK